MSRIAPSCHLSKNRRWSSITPNLPHRHISARLRRAGPHPAHGITLAETWVKARPNLHLPGRRNFKRNSTMTSHVTTSSSINSIRSMRLGLFAAILAALIAAPMAHAQMQIATVPVQNDAFLIATNNSTDTVYVVNTCSTDPSCSGTVPGTVTVINGQTNMVTATVTVGINPQYAVVNSVTNKIYVSNRRDNTVSVIDGATNTVIKT